MDEQTSGEGCSTYPQILKGFGDFFWPRRRLPCSGDCVGKPARLRPLQSPLNMNGMVMRISLKKVHRNSYITNGGCAGLTGPFATLGFSTTLWLSSFRGRAVRLNVPRLFESGTFCFAWHLFGAVALVCAKGTAFQPWRKTQGDDSAQLPIKPF